MAGTVPARLSAAQQGRKFGLTVGLAFLVLAAISVWRGHVLAPRVMGGLGAALLAGALLVPALLLPVEKAWMGFAHVLSKITTPIFMGVVYYLVFTPFGLVRRALGKSGLVHQPVHDSYWIPLDRAARTTRSMRRQF